MRPDIKFPYVLSGHEEVEAFLRLLADHFFAQYVRLTGENPPKVAADALGHALRSTFLGLPNPLADDDD